MAALAPPPLDAECLGLAPLAMLSSMTVAVCLPSPQRWEVGTGHLCALFLSLLSSSEGKGQGKGAQLPPSLTEEPADKTLERVRGWRDLVGTAAPLPTSTEVEDLTSHMASAENATRHSSAKEKGKGM